MKAPLSLCMVLVSAWALSACGRSELVGPDPDAAVVGDVPLDQPDTPDVPPDRSCQSNAECNDGRFCNGVERCEGGLCRPGLAVNCDDGVSCTVDRCDDASGRCTSLPNDGLCMSGRCDPVRDCTAIQCTNDRGCDNGNLCDGAERCVAGLCTRGEPLACDDGVACTVDRCVPNAGCVREPNDALCNDGSFCNGRETCSPMGCMPGRPVLCGGSQCAPGRCDEAAQGCVMSPPDADGDGFIARACGGDDCDDANARVNPRTPEVCGNGLDDNCDGRADCADSACAANPTCGPCVPTGAETNAMACLDGLDNDCDRLVDCGDPDCRTTPACAMCVATGPELMGCNDGRDNDCNGLTDCRDPQCLRSPLCLMCVPTGPEAAACNDGRDNDCNGSVDCADPACAGASNCRPANDTCESPARMTLPGVVSGTTLGARDDFSPTCAQGGAPDLVYVINNPQRQTLSIDTEGSSFDTVLTVHRGVCQSPAIACNDDSVFGLQSQLTLTDAEPGLYFIVVDGFSANSAGPFRLRVSVGLRELCNNGRDDDGDALVDCRDPDCGADPVCAMCMAEGPEQGPRCSDGRDNDCDNRVDCDDPECSASPLCCQPTGPEVGAMACADGLDNDCNGRRDCDESACASAPVCCRPTGSEADPMSCADGRDNNCNGLVDCAEASCQALPTCCRPSGAENTDAACRNGRDEDCDGLVDCADPECNGRAGCACVPQPEQCFDGADNDCDGLVDCRDTACATEPRCVACMNPSPETNATACADGRDNDCDGQTDCADANCAGTAPCAMRPPNDTCANPVALSLPATVNGTTLGAANDTQPVVMGFPGCAGGSGADVVYIFRVTRPTRLVAEVLAASFDTVLYVRREACEMGAQAACNDDFQSTRSRLSFDATPGVYYLFVDGFSANSASTFTLRVAEEATAEICNNNLDDDGDGLTDCRDTECTNNPLCRCVPSGAENNVTACIDGRDNDCDGQTDCNDVGCMGLAQCCRPTGSEADPMSCADGRDNDCDGQIDCNDLQCQTSPACCRPTGVEADPMSCADGRDNDCDGQIDCNDSACRTQPVCCRPTAAREYGVAACTDGVDNDCDGVADCADSDCRLIQGPEGECCNGRDDNSNGVIDEFACACERPAQCQTVGQGGPFPSNTCWSTTFRVCAPRCDLLGGNRFCSENFGPNARCNLATGECQ
ncbi:MAG: hypothetical protein JNK72_11255 [Myxococcales bacterium]|nr:hypothetical protein [Myxococcales bacterium]